MAEKSIPPKSIPDEVNDYSETVNALLGFAALVVYDRDERRPDTEFGFGRKMTTSSQNRVGPLSEVTPDLVVQKSLQFGIVVEAKKSLPQDRSRWGRHVERLRKYDDNLKGWWTQDEIMSQYGTVMLIHQSRGRAFIRFLEDIRNEDADAVGSATSVVEFNRSDETTTFYFYRLEFGEINDDEINVKLDEGASAPIEEIRRSFPNIQYYDAKPPTVLLLTHLWTDMFPSFLEEAEYDEKFKAHKILVSLEEVTSELQAAYGSGALYQDGRSTVFISHW